MVEATIARWQRRPPPGPVIIAGSTGSVPSTADLMAAVLSLAEGAVVLPGLATAAPSEIIAASLFDCAHPEHTMNRLVERLGIEREDIGELGAPAAALAARLLVTSPLEPRFGMPCLPIRAPITIDERP